ncbi:MAG: sugar ABC transporter permease [Propionicimonas sp.]|uniref:carbohydrate ABC transporter permease n=1 Tax=Propionicimonas sp. TaxID=1955623 RepID=UPI002B1F3065|nr:sugar ABC transporter permease [Propionicimonas sp.]MEA4945425.1 sugar ABC transporter permease [Propionicimonas sp.]
MAALVQAGPAATAGPAPTTRRRRDSRLRLWAEIALFTGPALIVFVTFVILPVLQAAVYSLYNWNGLGPLQRFIGLDNYVRAFNDPNFTQAIGNNFFVLVASLLIQGPLAILIALLLNRKLPGRGIIRAAIFVPYVLAEVIAALSWKLLLSPRGALNAWLELLGLGDLAQPWLANPDTALWVMFGILTWKYLGFAILIMLAGLQGVPEELHEAAAIDGAGWWKTQWYITMPLLGPTIRIWVFLSMIGSLQLFDMVWVTTRGGPLNSTNTMAVYMLVKGQTAPGYGSAIAVILFVISLVIALVYQRFAMRRDLTGAISRGVR